MKFQRHIRTLQEIVTLAGYATRVSDMLTVFGEVARGRCVRSVHVGAHAQPAAFQVTFRDNQPVPMGQCAISYFIICIIIEDRQT
jgi:hypothetical protein